VEGDGAPHINRSVEAGAMPVSGIGFFPNVAELHPGTRALVPLLKRSRNAAITSLTTSDGACAQLQT
jgi:hypothetical protein